MGSLESQTPVPDTYSSPLQALCVLMPERVLTPLTIPTDIKTQYNSIQHTANLIATAKTQLLPCYHHLLHYKLPFLPFVLKVPTFLIAEKDITQCADIILHSMRAQQLYVNTYTLRI